MAIKPKETETTEETKTAVTRQTTAVATQPQGSKAIAKYDFDDLLFEDSLEASNFSLEDLPIPFIRILQDMSPVAKKSDPSYVQGAEAGMLFNTASKELWEGSGEGSGIVVIPVHYEGRYVEWYPRDSKAGTGFVQDHGVVAPRNLVVGTEKGRMLTANGTEIFKTGTYYCLLVDVDTGVYEQVIIPMQSTQLRNSRVWNALTRTRKFTDKTGKVRIAPLQSWAYLITSKIERKDQYSWYGFEITPFREVKKLTDSPERNLEIYVEARDFRQQITAGTVNVKMEHLDATESQVNEVSDFDEGEADVDFSGL